MRLYTPAARRRKESAQGVPVRIATASSPTPSAARTARIRAISRCADSCRCNRPTRCPSGDCSNQKQRSLSAFGGTFTTYANGATIPNNILLRAAPTSYTLMPSDPFARRVDLDAQYQHFMKRYGLSGEVDWDLGPATLTSLTAYRWWDWYPKNDVDGTSLDVKQALLNNFQRQFSQEVRIASNGTNRVDYVTGLYYFWQTVRGEGVIDYGRDYAEWNIAPTPANAATIAITDAAMTGFRAENFSNPTTKSYAAFGQADWHITDALTLTACLRYTHEVKAGEFRQFWTAGLDLSTLSPPDREIATSARARSAQLSFACSMKADALSGLLTLGYKPTRDVLLYATYARGNKSGGLNLTAGGVLRPVIQSEKVDSFELGANSRFFDRALTVNLAAFRTEVREYQKSVQEFIGQTNNTRSYIANIPKARSRGLEANIKAAPTSSFSFTASAAYTDASNIRYANAPQAPERLNEGQIQDLSGKRLPSVPKFAGGQILCSRSAAEHRRNSMRMATSPIGRRPMHPPTTAYTATCPATASSMPGSVCAPKAGGGIPHLVLESEEQGLFHQPVRGHYRGHLRPDRRTPDIGRHFPPVCDSGACPINEGEKHARSIRHIAAPTGAITVGDRADRPFRRCRASHVPGAGRCACRAAIARDA